MRSHRRRLSCKMFSCTAAMAPPGAPGARDGTPPTTAEGTCLPAMPNDPAVTAGRWPAELRLMAVHAHPDDESSKGAATMPRYVRSGEDVMVCTLTRGERGAMLPKALDQAAIPGAPRPEH